MARWFRLYDETLNDPKILRLNDGTHRIWIGVLCAASKNEGRLPPLNDLALMLRVTPAKMAAALESLTKSGLIDQHVGFLSPHNWHSRQYKSDVSTERVKRFRNGHRNVSETPPEQIQSTDTEQNRTDTRTDLQKRVGNFRQAIVKAFEDANSPTVVETSRAELWLTQGYQEDICLAVISDIVKRKPSITTLSYFDKPISDAHASKAPPRLAVPMTGEQPMDWDAILQTYKKIGHWSKWAGPDLTSPACRAPRELLEKYGLLADGRTVN